MQRQYRATLGTTTSKNHSVLEGAEDRTRVCYRSCRPKGRSESQSGATAKEHETIVKNGRQYGGVHERVKADPVSAFGY